MSVGVLIVSEKEKKTNLLNTADPAPSSSQIPCDIVWLRDDLRVAGNEALSRASSSCLICVYVMSSEECETKTARAAWLRESLFALDSDLRSLGSYLVVLSSNDPVMEIVDLAEKCNSRNIFLNGSKSPDGVDQEMSLMKALPSKTLLHIVGQPWLVHPRKLLTKSGTPFRVFSHFFKSFSELLNSQPIPSPPLRPPFLLSPPSAPCQQISILSCQEKKWAQDMLGHWGAGEMSALLKATAFFKNPENYLTSRNTPALKTTVLSPHLRHGEISEPTLWRLAAQSLVIHKKNKQNTECILTFMRQLAWREFSYYLWFHDHDFPFNNWQSSPVKWEAVDPVWLKSWKKGETGIPLVDAGMRELWQTGWMHNRVRMVVADHFCKHMGYDWRIGASWFLKTLIDADVANNSLGWQWASGTGPDAAPYYRVFNPTLQAEKFDKDGLYRKNYLPELATCSLSELTEPWLSPALAAVYPAPKFTPKEGRARALEAFKKAKK